MPQSRAISSQRPKCANLAHADVNAFETVGNRRVKQDQGCKSSDKIQSVDPYFLNSENDIISSSLWESFGTPLKNINLIIQFIMKNA